MKLLSTLFTVSTTQRSNIQIILWWELRRILYNLILLVGVFLCLNLLGIHISTLEMGGGDYFMFLILIFYILLCNGVYTFFWIIELFRKRSLTYAPELLKIAIILSLLILGAFTALVLFLIG